MSTPFLAKSMAASLTVKDLPKSLAWYTDVLGCVVDETYEHEGRLVGAGLKAGDVFLMIVQDDGAKGWDRIKGQGISLYVTTEQDIDEVASRIKAAGGVLDDEPADMPWGARTFRLRDPDGFLFTISTVV